MGSGVVLPSGDIVTNYHVVKAGGRYTVGQRGKTAPAFLQGSDPDKDLALLLAPGLTATPALLGQASRLKVGEPVYAVGAPQGLELSLSEGIVSQLRGDPPPIIQTTVAISPGSSGGGLFNAKGELVGIMTFYLEGGQSLNFALPVEWIREVATSPTMGQDRIIRKKEPIAPEPEKRSEGIWADRATALIEAQDWKGLLTHCRQWTRTKPDFAPAWFGLGCAYRSLGRYREAIEAYRAGLRLNPDNAFAWYDLGVAYGNMGRYQEAIEPLRKAVRLKPDYVDAWTLLSGALSLSGKHAAAMEAVNHLRRYDPQKADAVLKLIIKP
jgi:hypothetical protein